MASPFFEKSEASWAEWASACLHYFLTRTSVNQPHGRTMLKGGTTMTTAADFLASMMVYNPLLMQVKV